MRPYFALAVVLAGALIAPLDAAVNVAFPAITSAFDLDLPEIRWLVMLYVLTYGSLMLVGGRLGDLHGYRRVFGFGLCVVAASFTACALAASYEVLLAARVGQGLGVALVLGCGPALALSQFPATERTRVLGRYTSMLACGSAVGVLAGGVLIAAWGWQAVFWMRVPLALGALAFLWLIPMPDDERANRPFDMAGAMLLATWTGALMFGLALGEGPRWWLALLALAAFAGFVAHESRVSDPILRPALFRDTRFTIMNLLSVGANFAAFAVPLLGPYYFARGAGLDAIGIGSQLGVWAGGTLAGAALAERLGRRFGLERAGLFGVALCVVGLSVVGTWNAGTGLLAAAAVLAVQGFGVGVFQVAYADRVMATLPRRDHGVAGSLTMLTRMLGVAASATLLTALQRDAESAALAAGMMGTEAFLEGFRFAFRCAAGGLATCLAVGFAAWMVARSRAKG
jgi:MFS family permease